MRIRSALVAAALVLLGVGVGSLSGCSPPSSSQPESAVAEAPPATTLSKSEFRQAVQDRIQTLLPDATITAIGELTLRIEGAMNHSINLESGYKEHLTGLVPLEEIVAKWADTTKQIHQGTLADDANTDALVLVLRPLEYITSTNEDGEWVYKPLVGDVVQVLMLDRPTMLIGLRKRTLDRNQMTEEQAWALAEQNTQARMGRVDLFRLGGDGGPDGMVAPESGLGTALVLALAPCSASSPNGSDGRVYLVLDRDAVLYGDPRDPDSMRRFWSFFTSDRGGWDVAINTPITCREGRWAVAEPPA